MDTWTSAPMLPWDTETDGLDTENGHIVQAAIAWINPAEGKNGLAKKAWILNHGIDIPKAASDVHGITRERCDTEGLDPATVLDQVAQHLADGINNGWPLVGMNVPFDFTMLDRGCRRLNVPTLTDRLDGRPVAPVIDVYVLDKHVDPYRKGKRNLSALCERYGVPIVDAHDATGDALAAARVAWRMGQLARRPADWLRTVWGLKSQDAARFAALGGLSLLELHEVQVAAKAQQARSFREYRAKQNKPSDDVSEDWPLIPLTACEQQA
ncbi:exonuclease domain-containing protein [Nonomuraea rhizosphaerae]|uniref:exonuclease domain-containing protein n=1 Tax=Nonomuraea rhizosphaerae TaxID=2665663 RepID=UPI001C5DE017|nr:exonuclease domain-containing protein [Nonomuraea rhizosphaerae]